MTTDNKTLADAQPGGRVRLGDRPKDGEVLVEVSGLTGSGKSAIAGEIEILCKALGLEVEWVNGDEEKRLTHADWIGALEMYKPKVVIVEQNIPRAALSAQPSPGGQDAQRIVVRVAGVGQCTLTVNDGAIDIPAETIAGLAARQPVGEPVAFMVRWKTEGGFGLEWPKNMQYFRERADEYEIVPLYAAPAQAVDLGQEHVATLSVDDDGMLGWKLTHMGRDVPEGEYRLALIDSQAVGK